MIFSSIILVLALISIDCPLYGEILYLPTPGPSQSVETAMRNIYGLSIGNNQLFALTPWHTYLLISQKVPFKKSTMSNPQFEPAGRMIRQKLAGIPKKERWHGISYRDNRLLLLNGWDMTLFDVDTNKYRLISTHSVIWDQIKPPADSRGEPPYLEISAFQRKFRSNLQAVKRERFVGLTWQKNSKRWQYYLMGTRIEKHPVVQLKCDHQTRSRCQVIRGCFVATPQTFKGKNLTGFAFHRSTQTVALAEAQKQVVHFFKYHSCYDVAYSHSLKIPSRLKKIRGVFFDDEARLWVSTNEPDDYTNGSIFWWSRKDWQKKHQNSAPTERSN